MLKKLRELYESIGNFNMIVLDKIKKEIYNDCFKLDNFETRQDKIINGKDFTIG